MCSLCGVLLDESWAEQGVTGALGHSACGS